MNFNIKFGVIETCFLAYFLLSWNIKIRTTKKRKKEKKKKNKK
jgi:hypothetical protein